MMGKQHVFRVYAKPLLINVQKNNKSDDCECFFFLEVFNSDTKIHTTNMFFAHHATGFNKKKSVEALSLV